MIERTKSIIKSLTEFIIHRFEWVILLTGFIAINLVFIPKAFRETDTFNPVGAGQLGDFVGGYIGTFFTLVSVVLLLATLKSQRYSAQLLNFETKYFEMLRMHRDNVAELEVQGVTGRKLFVVLIRELRSLVAITKQVAKIHSQCLSQKELLIISYYCLFFGTGPNSSRMLSDSLRKYESDFVSDLICKLGEESVKDHAKNAKKFPYVPFEGHQSRLGHYFRHLYQTVKYVDQQIININKYEYTKTIRAQLSNHEQALLLINSLTPIGSAWWDDNFIIKYRLVKNIPFSFFDPNLELDIKSLNFEAKYFEFEEVA